MTEMRDRLHDGLGQKVEGMRLDGHPEKRLPNTVNLSFSGVDAGTLLSEIVEDVAASAGAACHSGGVEISHVLKAMKVPVEVARGTLRFSVGRETTEEEIDTAVDVISDAVIRLRERPSETSWEARL
jgi:cysteine desulfurase